MNKSILTLIWLIPFAVFIIPLQAYEYHKRTILYEVKTAYDIANNLEIGWLNCIDADIPVKVFFNKHSWVLVKCQIVDHNLTPSKRRPHGVTFRD